MKQTIAATAFMLLLAVPAFAQTPATPPPTLSEQAAQQQSAIINKATSDTFADLGTTLAMWRSRAYAADIQVQTLEKQVADLTNEVKQLRDQGAKQRAEHPAAK